LRNLRKRWKGVERVWEKQEHRNAWALEIEEKALTGLSEKKSNPPKNEGL